MHKILKEKFMVVRSSAFDDYENGVDNIIVNKETGDVVCAFDEVRDNSAVVRKQREEKLDEKTRTEAKEDKIRRKAKGGGAKIKYGFGSVNGELVKKPIKSVLIFYISVTAADLDKLLEKMDYYSENPNKTELEIFDKLIVSLGEQVKMLKKEEINSEVAGNLDNFEASLKAIEGLRGKF